MLYLYDKKSKILTPCGETEFRKHGLLERQHLAQWVDEDPAILGEDLLVITSEYDKFDKTNERLDLLAVDRAGNLVVIELKRDGSGKRADLQAIKYAAYCSTHTLEQLAEMYANYQKRKGITIPIETAKNEILGFIESDDFEEFSDRPRIVLVASDFRPEVTASVLWLRKFGLDITCVKLDPYELPDGSVAFSSSVLIPLPEARDYIIRAERKEVAERTKTRTQRGYIEFYTKCLDALNGRLPGDYSTPSGASYYQIATGVGGVHFEWGFHGRPRSSFGAELHIEKSDKQQSKALILECAKVKDRLEAALREEVVIQKDWGKAWARLYVERQEGKMTDDLQNWAVEKMLVLIQILQPELDRIKNS